MKLYLLVIGISMAIISVINIIFNTGAWYYVIIAVVWCTLLQFVLDGIIAILINKMPDCRFSVDNPHFSVSDKERALYKVLRVRLWKNYVWELGWLSGFSKRRIKEPSNPVYIEKYIIECNKGVLTHRLSYPIGFLAMLTLPGVCAFSIALPVALVNVFLNVLPTLVLRYNTPMLKSLLKRLKNKEKALLEVK